MRTQLTPRQQLFVEHYLVDSNGARAAVAAGYGRAGARVRAHRLITANAAVRAEIARRQAQDSRHLQIERRDVIKGLLEAVEVARQQREPAAMIAAWKALATMLGFMAPQRHQVEVSASAGDFERMSDAELLCLLAQGAG